MKEKIGRTILIVLSIGVSAMLLYITIYFNEYVEIEALKSLTSEYGETDIIARSNDITKSFLMDEEIQDENISMQVPLCVIPATFDHNDLLNDVLLIGIKDDDIGNIVDYNSILIASGEAENHAGISEAISEKYSLNLGDKIEVEAVDKKIEFVITEILENEGYIYDESSDIKIMVSFDDANEIIGTKDMFNVLYIDNIDESDAAKDEMIERLEINYDELYFTEIDTSLVEDSLNSNLGLPLLLILIVSSIMGALIIFTTYNIVLLERLKVIGTFLCVGIRYIKIILILLAEAALLGLMGGCLGLGNGILIVSILADSRFSGISIEWLKSIEINWLYGATSILFAVILSIITVSLSISKLRGVTIKHLILGKHNNYSKNRSLKVIITRIVIIVVLLIAAFIFRGSIINSILIIVVTVLSVILFLPLIFDFLAVKDMKLFVNNLPIGYISLKNVFTTKMLINNINLIIVCVTIVLLVGTISTAVIDGFDELFSGYNSDLSILMYGEQQELYDYIDRADEIEDYYYFYSYNQMPIKDDDSISLVQGVEYEKYGEFNTYFSYTDGVEVLDKLSDDDRLILLSLALLDKYDKEVGDEIILLSPDEEILRYEIAGSFNARMAYMGSFALISIENMKSDFGIEYPNSVSMKLKEDADINAFFNKVKRSEINDEIQSVVLESTKKDQDIKMTSSFLDIIEKVSIITIILATIGVINNIIISFVQRKKVLATYDSIGIDRRKKKGIIILENIFIGIISITISIVTYYLVIENIQEVLHFIGIYIDVAVNIRLFLTYSSIVFIEIIIAGLLMGIKVNKLSIIDELRYE